MSMADFDLATPYNQLIETVQPILRSTGFNKIKLHKWDGPISANVSQIDVVLGDLLTYLSERSHGEDKNFTLYCESDTVEAVQKAVVVLRQSRQLLQGTLDACNQLGKKMEDQKQGWVDLDPELDALRPKAGSAPTKKPTKRR